MTRDRLSTSCPLLHCHRKWRLERLEDNSAAREDPAYACHLRDEYADVADGSNDSDGDDSLGWGFGLGYRVL